MTTTIVVGGPAYNLQADVRHLQSMMELTRALDADGDYCVIGTAYEHDALLPIARERLLHTLLKTEANLFLSMDSDTFFNGATMAVALLNETISPDVALYAALVPQRDNLVNAWRRGSDGKVGRLLKSDALEGVSIKGKVDNYQPKPRVELAAVGLACAVFNLDWYRNLPKRTLSPSRWFDTFCEWHDDGIKVVGEDIHHCRMVESYGGRIIGWPGVRTFHDGRMQWA